tara:strand:+ start:62007 stop:62489 length:483 start_codon:yes stop_codon:yes gene_type:complete
MTGATSNSNFQREGAVSNAHVGRDFENVALRALRSEGISLYQNHRVAVGVGGKKKDHAFDLGSGEQKVLVECKSHRWTKGNNVPSAKITTWNEAMYYFAVAPSKYRKIMFVLRDARKSTGETLAEYYVRLYSHLIPDDVELWEYDEQTDGVKRVINDART